MITPLATARSQVSSRVRGSPAWKPQATLALLTTSSMASSSPSCQVPKPSPRSLLRSMVSLLPAGSTGEVVEDGARRADTHVPGQGGHPGTEHEQPHRVGVALEQLAPAPGGVQQDGEPDRQDQPVEAAGED